MFSSGAEDYSDPEMSVAGIDPRQVSTAEQARPLPVHWGTQRMGVTFVSDAFNKQYVPENKETGKSEMTIGWHYFVQFSALVCHGPVLALHAIYFDGKLVWPYPGSTDKSPLVADGDKSSLLFDNGRCYWDIYWGTETQVIDTRPATIPSEAVNTKYLDELADPEKTVLESDREYHPAYKGQCYIVPRIHYMGYNRTNVQNIELVVTRCPTFEGITPAKIGTAGKEDANVPVIIADALTNKRYGLGLPTSYIDLDSFQAVATILNSEGIGISPVLTTCQPFDQFIVDVLNYVDGYFFSTPTGKIGLGLNRGVPCQNDEDLENQKVLRIDETCLIDRPKLRTPSIANSRNTVYVTFSNQDADYQNDAAPAHSAGTLAMQADANSPAVLDRPWVTDVHIASIMSSVAAKVMSLPADELTCRIKRSSFVRPDGLPIMVGNGVYFSYAQYRLCHAHYVLQEIRQGDPHEPFVELVCKRDRSYVNLGNQEDDPAADYEAPGRPVGAVPPDITYWSVIEFPNGMQNSITYRPATDLPQIVVCASIPGASVSGAFLSYLKTASPEAWASVGVAGGFHYSPIGHFYNDLDDDDTTADFELEPTNDVAPVVGDDYVLIACQYESLEVTWTSLEIIGAHIDSYDSNARTYRMTLTRGFWDTCPDGYREPITTSHKWFIVSPQRVNWATVPKPSVEGDTLTFILQSASGSTPSDAATAAEDANQRSTQYHNRYKRPITPKVVTCADTWNENGDLTITWTDPVTPDKDTYRYIDVRGEGDTMITLTDPTTGSVYNTHVPCDVHSLTIAAADLASLAGRNIVVTLFSRCPLTGPYSSFFAQKLVAYA